MYSIGLSFSESLTEDRPRSLTSAVQERLRTDILSTRLLPGQKLHIAGLAKQFSVSLAAVREALSRLVADGLVQASDQRGFRVSPVSPADLRDVTQTRVDIEGLAQSAPRTQELKAVAAPKAVEEAPEPLLQQVHTSAELVEMQLGIQADAPLCFSCGTKMQRAGSCYICEGCGSTSGCS